MPRATPLVTGILVLMLTACSTSGLPPLRGTDQTVDLERFMGPWFVIASIPIDIPFLPMFSEKGAHNGIETYRLTDEGTIETTYTFRQDSFDGPERVFRPRARTANPPRNSEWKMKFAWYLPASDYLILRVDPDYRHTVIGVPDRKFVWIMSRTATMPEAEYSGLVDWLKSAGYDTALIERVPQRWPD